MRSRTNRLGKIARLFVRFGPLLKPHRRRLALSACFMLAFIATDLVGPWPVQGVIDGVLLGRRSRGFMFWLGGLLPSDRMDLLAVCCLAVVIVGMLAFMAMMDLTLTLIAVSTLPLLLVATARYGGLIRQASREQRRKEGKVATVANEALASVAMIQAYSREQEVAARFSRQSFKSLSAGLRSLRLEESLGRIVDMTIAVGSCLVLWVGARRSLAGGMSPGELVVFLAYLRGLYKPTREDRKSTRLNSSHLVISYAVFCLKKKKNITTTIRTM